MTILPQVISLKETECKNIQLVGAKAATLALLLQNGFFVPSGFCLTTNIYKKLLSSLYDIELLPDLKKFFTDYISSSRSKALVVRSSGIQEDNIKHTFSGIFLSFLNIKTLPDLLNKIVICMQSVESKKVKTYCNLLNIFPNKILMGVLIQQQIIPEFSGVAFTRSPLPQHHSQKGVLIEISKGESSAMLMGGAVEGSFFVREIGNSFQIQVLSSKLSLHREMIYPILRKVAETARNIEAFLGNAQNIEWAFDENVFYVIQARPINIIDKRQRFISDLEWKHKKDHSMLLPGEDVVGLKGSAMMFFAKMGWFKKNVIFLQPYSNIKEFEKNLNKKEFGKSGLTIRYSFANEIGLPRFFVKNKTEVLPIISKTWQKKWLGIIHDYINVRRSFELYVNDDYSVLEHVPGVWESDSTVTPDVLIKDSKRAECFRVTQSRKCKLLSSDGQLELESPPLSADLFIEWNNLLDGIIEKLRFQCRTHLPVICRFVADENEDWHFLNLRRSDVITRHFLQDGHFHVVRSIKDLEIWNRKDPILLQLNIDRGLENLIGMIVPALPKDDGVVYIDFGILSHPAIVLRELGVNPIPVYLTHEHIKI